MGTSSLTDSNLKISTTKSDRLFYDTYRYVLFFRMPGVETLRCCKGKEIDDVAASIDQRLLQRQQYRSKNWGGNWKPLINWATETQACREDLVDLAVAVLSQGAGVRFVVTKNQGYLYSNDVAGLHTIAKKHYMQSTTLREAVIDRPRNTVRLKKSQHLLRTYFNNSRLTAENKARLINFFNNNVNEIRYSPSLADWVSPKSNWHWVSDHLFFDHNDTKLLLMLGLVCPGIVKKTLDIID